MDLQEICSVVKFAPEGGIRGKSLFRFPRFFFSAVDSFDTSAEMTCNPFQTELTSHTKANNLFETVSLAVDRLSRPCPFEKFAGAQKLALLSAAKTAKGKMVKYAVPAAKNVASTIKQNIVDQVKFKVGVSLGVFDAVKSTVTGLYKTGKYLVTTDPKQICEDAQNIGNLLKYAKANPKQVLTAAKNGIVNGGKAFITANPVQQGRVVGRIGGEIGLSFVGTKGIDKLGKVAQGTQFVAKLSNAAKATRAGQMLGRASSGIRSVTGRLITEEAGSLSIGAQGTRQTTILGENMADRVIPFAEKTGSRTLPWGTTPEKWAKMTPKERWKLNDGLLRARINEGDSFRYIGQGDLNDHSPIATKLRAPDNTAQKRISSVSYNSFLVNFPVFFYGPFNANGFWHPFHLAGNIDGYFLKPFFSITLACSGSFYGVGKCNTGIG